MDALNDYFSAVSAFTSVHQATIMSVLVASANVFLAVVTWLMARATRDMARQTFDSVGVSRDIADTSLVQVDLSRDQFNLSRQALLSSVQPLLLDAPSQAVTFVSEEDDWRGVHVAVTRSHIRAELSFINVGVGVALVQSAEATIDNLPATLAESISRRVVRPDETTRVAFQVPHMPLSKATTSRRTENVVVVITYGNILGTQNMSSEAHLNPVVDGTGGEEHVVAELILRGPDNVEFRLGSGSHGTNR